MKKYGKYVALFLLAVIAVMSVFLFNNGFGGKIIESENSTAESSFVPAEVSERKDRYTASVTSEEPFSPSKEWVESARSQALEGMSEKEIDALTDLITAANLTMEQLYFNDNIFEALEDPDSFSWNHFTQKGKEIPVGVAMDEDGTETEVVTDIPYNVDDFVAKLNAVKATVRDEQMKETLQAIADEAKQGAEHHDMAHINAMFQLLHDTDYFLLRYGPEIKQGEVIFDRSFVSTFYDTLPFYR